MESTESEEQKEKGMKTSEESLWDLWEIDKQITYALWDSQKERAGGAKKISEETMAESFPNLMEDRYKY